MQSLYPREWKQGIQELETTQEVPQKLLRQKFRYPSVDPEPNMFEDRAPENGVTPQHGC